MRLVTVFFQHQCCSVLYVGFAMGSFRTLALLGLYFFSALKVVHSKLMDCVIGSATDNLFVVKNKPKNKLGVPCLDRSNLGDVPD